MVIQYPYQLFILQTSDSLRDSEGNFLNGNPTWLPVSKCRDEANTKGQVILSDGSAFVFESLIYLPKHCQDISAGTEIQVRNGLTVRIQGKVKRFQKDQLHARLWL